jgi:NAD-dependent dihydropyrimidine dehydrogenase PreA subunit
MLRKIVEIDESKCDGCGQCVPSCAEGAIAVVDGKARLVGDVLCDGLGACLGECPRGAIRVIEREAPAFDERAVRERLASARPGEPDARHPAAAHAATPAAQRRPRLSIVPSLSEPASAGGCPGSRPLTLQRAPTTIGARSADDSTPSRLGQWPVQLHLVSPQAPYFRNADLLVAADCVPFAYARFHQDFLDGRAVVVGCPKLDDVAPYASKLAAIIGAGRVKSVTVVRMEVPCCGGISRLVRDALAAAGSAAPLREVVVGVDGAIRAE